MSGTVGRFTSSIALSALSMAGLWWADMVLQEASREAATTFTFPVGRFALSALLFALAGAAIGSIFLLDRFARSRRWGHLFVAAILPSLLVANFFLFLNGFEFGLTMADGNWLFSQPTIAIASFTVGSLVTVATVRSLSRTSEAE